MNRYKEKIMPASWVDINVNASAMEGYLTQPEAEGRHPAIVVIPEIWGKLSHPVGGGPAAVPRIPWTSAVDVPPRRPNDDRPA
jgi:hypothetical protein